MTTKSETRNGTGAAAKRPKKTQRAPSPSAEWDELRPCLDAASKAQVEALAGSLFAELWRARGPEAAAAIVVPFRENTEGDRNRNLGAVGKWTLDTGGWLTIERGLRDVCFSNDSVEVGCIRLESSEAADELVYRGGTDAWENCRDDFDVEMRLRYDPRADAIRGWIAASPCHDRAPEYGPDCVFGGRVDFVATREGCD